MAYVIDKDECTVCLECMPACPVDAIKLKNGFMQIDEDECIDCGACVVECPIDCISEG